MNLYAVPLRGSNKLHPNGTKLWDEFQSFKYRLVVDNHSPWEKCAKDETFADIAFVLATTALNERDRLLTLYEDRHGYKKAFPNVFFFGAEIEEVTEQGYMVKGTLSLERLDRDAVSLTDKEKLNTLGNMLSPQGLKRPKDEPDKERERLDALRQRGHDALQKEIKDKAPECFKNYPLSAEVARMALALLLEKEPDGRRTLDRKGSANSLSDAGLIKDALFLNSWIWSEDGLVRKMASYCGVRACREISAAALAALA